MKRGELVILWVGGLLSTAVLLLQAANVPRVPSELTLKIDGAHTVSGHIIVTVFILVAIWIVCGLVWVTLYLRTK
jgi:hypothetical protein